MTKKYLIAAAEIVRNIREGNWTGSPPVWAENYTMAITVSDDYTAYIRACQTAEAFCLLFATDNPRFDQERFLSACGLVDAPTKKRSAA